MEINSNTEALKKQELELTEMKEILLKTSMFFEQTDMQAVAETAQDNRSGAAAALASMHNSRPNDSHQVQNSMPSGLAPTPHNLQI